MTRFEARPTPVRQCLRPERRRRAEVVAAAAHLPAVLIGLRWLYDTTQPFGAVVDPRAHQLHSVRGRRGLRFDPVGRNGAVTIEMVSSRHETRDNTLAAAEVAAFGDLIDGLGEDIVQTWIGRGAVVGGVELARPAHGSLLSAVTRFEHGDSVDAASAVELVDVQRLADEQQVPILQFAGPWPASLDPSGLLGIVADRAVAQLAARPGRLGRL